MAPAADAAVLYVNVVNLWEAYGSGPSYYGRTSNMDNGLAEGPG